MARFLIEVPHDSEEKECVRVVKVFLSSGSHFLSNADWGCSDGEHKAWIIVEVESKGEATCIVPPAFRSEAKVVELTKFTMEEMDELLRNHAG
jgi:hypothetical protein